MSDKKEFKDTKVGKLLSKFSGLLPDKGVLSVVKNLIEEDDTLTPEQKKEASERLIRLYEAEVSDRDSARKREAEVRKYGFDFLFNITGLVILGAFAFLVYVITNAEVPPSNKEIFIHLIGIVEGSVISVVGYYFGTSMKKDK
jgi:hypothetical protein